MIKIKHGRTEYKGSASEVAVDITTGLLAISYFISNKSNLSVEESIDKIAKIAKEAYKTNDGDVYKEVKENEKL